MDFSLFASRKPLIDDTNKPAKPIGVVRKQRWYRGLIFAPAALLLSLLILEISLRVIEPKPAEMLRNTFRLCLAVDQPAPLAPNCDLHFEQWTVSGQEFKFKVFTNESGVRSPFPSTNHPLVDDTVKPATRIHCIGDSYTFGWGVNYEDSYPAKLQKLLGPAYRIDNLGIPGAGLSVAMTISERIAKQSPPDIMVYLFFPNDIGEDLKMRPGKLPDGSDFFRKLILHSNIASFIVSFAYLPLWTGFDPGPLTLFDGNSVALRKSLVWCLAKSAQPPPASPTNQKLKQLRDQCAASGRKLIVAGLLYDDCDCVNFLAGCAQSGIPVLFIGHDNQSIVPDYHLDPTGNAQVAYQIAWELDRFRRERVDWKLNPQTPQWVQRNDPEEVGGFAPIRLSTTDQQKTLDGAGIYRNGYRLQAGETYYLRFCSESSSNCTLHFSLEGGSSKHLAFEKSVSIPARRVYQTIELAASAEMNHVKLSIRVQGATQNVSISDIDLICDGEVQVPGNSPDVRNPLYTSRDPFLPLNWSLSGPRAHHGKVDYLPSNSGTVRVSTVSRESNPSRWDVLARSRPFPIGGSTHYEIIFKARADSDRLISCSLGQDHPPYKDVGFNRELRLTSQWQEFHFEVAPRCTDSSVRIMFAFGEDTTPFEIAECTLTRK